jgi:PKD repeat protein
MRGNDLYRLRFLFSLLALTLAAVAPVFPVLTVPAAAQLAQAQLVSPVPMAGTPNAVDGRVFAFAEVGNLMVMGGSFTQVRNADNSTIYNLPYVVAFDRTTGAINTSFAPGLDKQVETLLPGPAENTVYIGGAFNNIGVNGNSPGIKAKGLVLFNVVTGERVESFKLPPINGTVQRVRAAGGRVYAGGTFTTVGPEAHGGLVALNPLTGAVDPFVQTKVTERHNQDHPDSNVAAVGIFNFDINPAGTKLVAVGNFRKVDGISRDQLVMIDLTTSQATVKADWQVRSFEAYCGTADDTYVRDVDFSPGGEFIAIAAVGGHHTGTFCDSATRFEANVSSDNLAPTWVDFSGGDSILSVAVTGSVVYVGGHQRWLNNPDGRNNAQQGSVPRAGLAALDPDTGIPFSWNPGRSPRGAGAYSLLATTSGLWMGSDTDYIGPRTYFRGKVAFFPLAGGSDIPQLVTPHLPGGIYLGGQGGGPGLLRRSFDGTTAGATKTVTTGMDFSTVRGGFVLNDSFYYGKTDAKFYKRALTGGNFGPEVAIDPYNDPLWSAVLSGSGTPPNDTYRGLANALYPKLPSVTSLFYDNKRIYYTLSGDSKLYYRAFNPESGIVGAAKFTITGFSLPAISGAFLDGGYLYWALSSSGNLKRVPWTGGAPSGVAVTIGGPAINGVDWRANSLFIGPATLAPSAVVTSDCTGLACTVSGSASADQDGSIASYSWDFGDGSADSGIAPAAHTYAHTGTYSITLTVTDNDGLTASATKPVFVQPVPTSKIAFRASASANGNGTTASLTIPTTVQPGDGLILIATTGAAASQATPAGWSVVKTQAADPVLTTVWQRVAREGDAGSTVTVAFSGATKYDARLLAYQGTAAGSAAGAVATAASTVSSAGHIAPATAVAESGSWVLWYWADKSSATTSWTLPPDITSRGTSIGTGTGYLTSAVADTGAPQPIATVPARTASANSPALRATMASIVLLPAASLPPVVMSSLDCTGMRCAADAGGSSDPDGAVTSYRWDFGDGSDPVTTAQAVHDYAVSGTYQVTLTITDNTGMTAVRTRPVTVAPLPVSNVAFRGSAVFNGASAAPSVTVPAQVRNGDALVLISTSAAATSQSAPTGWDLVATKTAGAGTLITTIWQRVAQPADAGTAVAVTLSGSSKVDLHLLAYSGTAATSPVSAILAAETVTTATHTTPSVTVPVSGSWVVSYWSDKSSATTSWTAPSGITTRDTAIGSGSGYVSTLIADSGAPLGAVPIGGSTATANSAAAKAVTASLVLAPAP